MATKLVHTGYCNYGNTSRPIKVYVEYSSSQDPATNKSTITCGMYFTTVWPIGSWDDFNGSYVGTKSLTFDGTIPYTEDYSGTTKHWLASGKEFTVSHESDGKGSATIYWKWGVNSPWGQTQNPSGSFSITLPTIPRASSLTISDGTLDTAQTVKLTRASSAFRHTITYTCGSASGTILAKSTNATSVSWTPPISLASQDSGSGTSVEATITLKTYPNSSSTDVIGTATKTISLTIPRNSSTKPNESITVAPVNTGLPSAFSSLYIQGKSKVKVTHSASGKYNSTIKQYRTTVNSVNKTHTATSYTSGVLSSSGKQTITGRAYDTRGFYNDDSLGITVLAYSKPTIIVHSENSKIICERSDSSGTLSPKGTYLRIKAGRKYSTLTSGSTQYNQCTLYYRYAEQGSSIDDVAWTTILESSASGNEVAITLELNLNIKKIYIVQLKASDTLGESTIFTYPIPTADVPLHLKAGGKSVSIGEYATDDGYFTVADSMKTKIKGSWGGTNWESTDGKAIEVRAALGINPNILDNWYLASPINQRGATTYSGAYGHCIDRWWKYGKNGTLTLNDGYITLTNTDAGTTNGLTQYIEKERLIDGETYTLSIFAKITSGSLSSGNSPFLLSWGNNGQTITESKYLSADYYNEWRCYSFTFTWVAAGDIASFRIRCQGRAGSIQIKAMKLERGSTSSLTTINASGEYVLADDPPNVAQELAKCQRYFVKFPYEFIAHGFVTSSGLKYYMSIPLPVTMRAIPKIGSGASWLAWKSSGGYSAHSGSSAIAFTDARVGTFSGNIISIYDLITTAVDTNNTLMSYFIFDLELSAEHDV